MPTAVIMPRLGFTMEEGSIVEWLANEGDWVEAGKPLLLVETDKVVIEVEAKVSGTLWRILDDVGSTVPCTQTIGILLMEGEEPPSEIPSELLTAPTEAPAPEVPADRLLGPRASPASARTGDDRAPRAKASPVARRLAKEHGIALHEISGSGPQGRISKDDVLAAVAARQAPVRETERAPERQPVEIVSLNRIRRVGGERLAWAFQNVPHFYTTVDVDATRLVELRATVADDVEDRVGVKPSYTAFLVRMVAAALRAHPLLNATFDDGQVKCFGSIDMGIALGTDEGLLVPVIRRADELSVAEIALQISQLAERGRQGKLGLDELTGGTFTLSNLGMFGVHRFSPIINPPQSAILGVGATVTRPWAHDGKVALRQVMALTLAADHRVLDGIEAGAFLLTLQGMVENPASVLVI
ncbi:MAG: dihydrolipoamide acetyltransferase family protein [Anaerolineae bacterium]|jgi:pyruvate dehydrogenase E2 component (dihydrolipoamide acetyltransferase)